MELFAHQKDVLRRMKGKSDFAVFFEQGLGKTLVALKDFEQDKDVDTLVVIVAPNGIQNTWEAQIRLVGIDIPCFAYSGEARNKAVMARFNDVLRAPRAIFVFHVEMFNMGFEAYKTFIYAIWKTRKAINMTIDQSQSIKNPTAKRSILLWKLGKYANVVRRRILEGAPNEEGNDELYSQFRFLDEAIIGDKSFTSFKNKFCVVQKMTNAAGYTFDVIRGSRNQKVLMGLIAPVTAWVKREECLDLPAVIYKQIEVPLSPEEVKVFRAIDVTSKTGIETEEAKELSLEFGIDNDNLLLAFVYMLRAHQTFAGVFSEAKSKTHMLVSLLEEEIPHKEQVIVFCSYRAEVDSVVAALRKQNISCVGYYGGDDRSIVDDFTQGKHRVIVATHRRLGVGFNLQFCNNVVFHSCLYSARQRKECIARVDRIGQKKHPVVYDLIGTIKNSDYSIDKKILRMVQEKFSVAQMAYEIYKENQ